MFRKNGIIAAFVIAVILAVFDIFFLDMAVKASIIAAGQAFAKAKVDIGYLHVDVFKSKILVRKIEVADSKSEFRNMFSADEAVIDYMFLPLLENKYIIENISVINAATGTDRKTSGFLKAAEISRIEKNGAADKNSRVGKMQESLASKSADEIKAMPLSKLADIKDIKNIDLKNLFKKEDLDSYKAIVKASAGIKAEKTKAEAAFKAAGIDNKVRQTKESINKIKEVKVANASDIPAAKDALAELDKIKANADGIKTAVEAAKKDAESFYAYSKNAYREIDAAKEKDYTAVLEKADIKMLNAGMIEKALLGRLWYDRVQRVIYYMSLADKYIPKKKKDDKKSVSVIKRGTGREIAYSSSGRYPGFWIKKVVLSVNGADKGSTYYMKGELHDIAADQAMTGKPLKIGLILDNPSQLIDINGTVNHIDSIDDRLVISIKNLPASFIGLDKADLGNSRIEKAKVAISLNARNTSDYFMVDGSINVTDMQVTSTDNQDIAYLAIKGIKNLKVEFNLKQAEQFSLNVSSNVFDRIKKSLSGIYGSKIEKAKQDAKKAVDDAIKGEIKELTGTGDSSKGSVDSQLKDINSKSGQIQADIDRAKSEINKKITEAGGKNLLKGLFK